MEIFFSFLTPLIVLGGLGWAVFVGLRSLAGASGAGSSGDGGAFDLAAVARSAAVHIGLVIALIVCAIGAIDLLQSFVQDDRIAGSNSELARGLALLIVGVPVYAGLLRSIERRYAERRSAGDTRPHLGWTVYLVVSLGVTLIATVASIAQIVGRLTNEFDEFEPNELMQLVVWFGLWLLHWFALRPRYGVRGDVHLAVGSIFGLGWMLIGAAAVLIQIFTEAYDSLFDASFAGGYEVAFWLVLTPVGAAVWAWHWLVHFDREGSVEGDRRGSPLWYVTVVVAGVLPGLLTILVSATAMLSGLLIWFFGSTDADAVDYFEPVSLLVTSLLVGLTTWSYHRWELTRRGVPQRNESLRFHDYVVAAVGVVGTIGSVAVIIGFLIDAIAQGDGFAGQDDIGNGLIVTLTVLAASAAVWVWQWSHIERHRASEPVAESDSIWRKLYLTAAFGIGGVVLGVAVIWVLFVVLRDSLDAVLGQDTLLDLRGPIGWAVAVIGGVWYHVGVWRIDRRVLRNAEPRVSPPPLSTVVSQSAPDVPAPAGLTLRASTDADHGEILTLQRAAFVDEAVRAGTPSIPALTETRPDLEARLAASSTLVASDAGRIVGAASVRFVTEARLEVERLMVAPDRRREGIATRMLAELERSLAARGVETLSAAIAPSAIEAQTLFGQQGYLETERAIRADAPAVLVLTKAITAPTGAAELGDDVANRSEMK